jgi:hypothetical protein
MNLILFTFVRSVLKMSKVDWYSARCCGKEYYLSDSDKEFDPAPKGICRWCGSEWTKGFHISILSEIAAKIEQSIQRIKEVQKVDPSYNDEMAIEHLSVAINWLMDPNKIKPEKRGVEGYNKK